MSKSWTPEQARRAYAIPNWSDDYVDVGSKGQLLMRPLGPRGIALSLADLATEAQNEGLRLPLLLRFPDILKHRVNALREAFDEALKYYEYGGSYNPVYPIKTNQQRTVVSSLVDEAGVGLEVGSKPELITGIAMSKPGGLLICNGYKDPEYIRLALIGRRLGLRVILVIEMPGEVALIEREAERMKVEPELGVRLRLAATYKGNWQDSGGERAKFGLSASQIQELFERISAIGKQHWLKVLHFHMGSQISNLRDIQAGMREAGRFLVELRQLGAPIDYVDIGGGLGVDYEGARSRGFCSTNYTLRQYAAAIVLALTDLCAEHELDPPNIISESGRALSAHHAVLIAPVSATERVPDLPPDFDLKQDLDNVVLNGMRLLFEDLDERGPEECWLEAGFYLEEGQNRFLYGDLSLSERARLEQLYYALLKQIRPRLDLERKRHRELAEELDYQVSDKYYMNLSIFQSLPDVWALEQIFPIVPLERLNQEPTRRAVLEDLTCDSDGRIERYVDQMGLEKTLRVHPLDDDEQYLLGVFLVGAYQETLGDIHNLFGDTDSADAVLTDKGYQLRNLRHGDTARALLEYLGYQSQDLLRAYRAKIKAAELPAEDAVSIEAALQAGLEGYTYLES
ncbi:MAG: arginine decarboxylase [Wenzhouxiangellaceae bacterium]